jgi:flavin-binding protein dodecin
MLKTSIFVSLATVALLAQTSMPPMPPMIPMDIQKAVESSDKSAKESLKEAKEESKELVKKEVKKPASACDSVPPMLHILPPPLQDAVNKCNIEKSTPKKEAVEKKIADHLSRAKRANMKVKDVEVDSIKGIDLNLYEIKYTKTITKESTIYCNGSLTQCFKRPLDRAFKNIK